MRVSTLLVAYLFLKLKSFESSGLIPSQMSFFAFLSVPTGLIGAGHITCLRVNAAPFPSSVTPTLPLDHHIFSPVSQVYADELLPHLNTATGRIRDGCGL
ncbi:hypothetical protein B0H10DRAFT_1992469 [Mycena sp. CBHHK59/15]|nr:hypothetical protein B0H10DRAFT_1992469 [Mycena sp. CBHHK59/15]